MSFELALAKHACEEAAVIAKAIYIDDERAFEFGFNENHYVHLLGLGPGGNAAKAHSDLNKVHERAIAQHAETNNRGCALQAIDGAPRPDHL